MMLGLEGWKEGGKCTGQERTFQAVGIWELQRTGDGERIELEGAGWEMDRLHVTS